MSDAKLWLSLRNHPQLLCLPPRQLAILLEELADKIEARGDVGLDLDPGETADWLRQEAAAAKEVES